MYYLVFARKARDPRRHDGIEPVMSGSMGAGCELCGVPGSSSGESVQLTRKAIGRRLVSASWRNRVHDSVRKDLNTRIPDLELPEQLEADEHP